ncbi:hypothetical protein COV15_02325 [Candidatus Woesearchaeota archaeon CG10_big_fil_rev_8_21_14_0_10_34_12]|nr:MAG: hypothetical protein COV15_02325 [Candidatus Woesearchaeota archaeon CG10_big_fil_rev_8_21_14_0_10_34_12]
MLEYILKEKISADHLLYVSLKYTKTCDVMLNLIIRWVSLIEGCNEFLLIKAKKKGKLSKIPEMPKIKIDKLREIFKKEKVVQDALEMYLFFKRVENSQKLRENDFRKNVTLKILDRGNWVDINLDKLKEYNELLERFINYVRQYTL